jgi:hypothetical protein
MIRSLLSHVSLFRQRAFALLHRSDPLQAEAAERRERWNQVIAEHQRGLKPVEREAGKSKTLGGSEE